MYLLIYMMGLVAFIWYFHLCKAECGDIVTLVKSYSPESQVLVHRWFLAKGKHLFFYLFVSCVLFFCVFVIRSLLVCCCTCSLSLNTFAFEAIIYKNLTFKTSLNNTIITNPEKGGENSSLEG